MNKGNGCACLHAWFVAIKAFQQAVTQVASLVFTSPQSCMCTNFLCFRLFNCQLNSYL
uniref:Uncharacterized protein n=1 Tax=Arundo donax TaxID=35708 RepID=A0A0A9FPE8_ARUDO